MTTEEHGFKSAPATNQPTPGDSTVCPLSITGLVAHRAFKFLFGHVAIAAMLPVDRQSQVTSKQFWHVFLVYTPGHGCSKQG